MANATPNWKRYLPTISAIVAAALTIASIAFAIEGSPNHTDQLTGAAFLVAILIGASAACGVSYTQLREQNYGAGYVPVAVSLTSFMILVTLTAIILPKLVIPNEYGASEYKYVEAGGNVIRVRAITHQNIYGDNEHVLTKTQDGKWEWIRVSDKR